MAFSGKICPIIILKVTKKQGFNPSVENTVLGNHRGGQIDPSRSFKGQYYPYLFLFLCFIFYFVACKLYFI